MKAFRTFGKLALLTGAVLGTASCAKDTTQITVALTSETEIPEELDTLKVSVVGADGEVRSFTYDKSNGLDKVFFPGTAAVIPVSEKSFERPLTIELRGEQKGQTILFRRSRVSYIRDRNISIPMPLRMACVAVTCAEGQTCKGGQCVSDFIEPSQVFDYQEVRGDLAANCFEETSCLADSKAVLVTIKPTKANPGPFDYECTFPTNQATAGGKANVSIRWEQAQKRVITLDEGDALEGWVKVNETTGKLATGICASYRDSERDLSKRIVYDRALDVAVSNKCFPKTNRTAFCMDSAAKRVAGAGITWAEAPPVNFDPRPVVGMELPAQ
jgi:hypothetical protein